MTLLGVHNVFHVSQFKRCLKPPTGVVVEDAISLEPDLTYKTHHINIHDQQDRVTRNKTTRFYKVQWNNHSKDEGTWEHRRLPMIQLHRVPSIEVTTQPSLVFWHPLQSQGEIFF
jgi:hypothetical protein